MFPRKNICIGIIEFNFIIIKLNRSSHDKRPPVTDNEDHNEVSSYGDVGFAGDTNDHWRIELVDNDSSDSSQYIKAIHSRIRLVHVNTGCTLFSHKTKLPEWGFGQQEVTCAKRGKKSLTIWRIEYNENPFRM